MTQQHHYIVITAYIIIIPISTAYIIIIPISIRTAIKRYFIEYYHRKYQNGESSWFTSRNHHHLYLSSENQKVTIEVVVSSSHILGLWSPATRTVHFQPTVLNFVLPPTIVQRRPSNSKRNNQPSRPRTNERTNARKHQ
jgi:hypothetical protein